MELTSREIKDLCIGEGAEVAGIAPVWRFKTAGPGDRPEDKFGKCESVIVMGKVFPERLLFMCADEYTRSRMDTSAGLDSIAGRVEVRLKDCGYGAQAIRVCNERKDEAGFWDHLSMKRAAGYAGLGRMTRNHLLTNPRYGNMLCFAAVLTEGLFEPDEMINDSLCGGCQLCVVACPAGALNDPERLNQKECDRYRCRIIDGNVSLVCYECRRACPMRFGRSFYNGGEGSDGGNCRIARSGRNGRNGDGEFICHSE